MSEHTGDKTEQATPRKLEEALKHGNIPRSAEVQTVFVLLFALAALTFTGKDTWRQFVNAIVMSFSHLHDTDLSITNLQAYAVSGVLVFLRCAGPVVIATALGGPRPWTG